MITITRLGPSMGQLGVVVLEVVAAGAAFVKLTQIQIIRGRDEVKEILDPSWGTRAPPEQS